MSVTITGLIASVLILVFRHMEIDVAEESIQTTMETLGLIISGLMIYVGRYRHGDIDPLGRKI